MGKFLDFLTGGGSSAIGGIAQGVMSMFTARANRKHQEQENQKDREFNASEAQKQRDFEEEMYNKHESPTAQAQERKQAGLSPLEGVSSQSVGGGSSASSSSSSLPSAPTPDMSWLTNMGATIANLKKTNAETKLLEEERIGKYYENLKTQFEADPTRLQEVYDTNLAKLKAERDAKVLTAREYKARVEMLEEFRENGGNTYSDAHALNEAQIKELNERASKLSIEQAGEKIRNGISALEFSIKKKYGDSRERAEIANKNADTARINQIVSELQKTEDARISLQNAEIGFARLAMNEAERNDALSNLQNETEKEIARQLFDAVKEGGFKSLIVQMFLHDPVGTGNVITSLAPKASISKSHSTNVK